MQFLWPPMLWLLAALPLLVAAYVMVLRRRRKAALRYASLALVREAAGGALSIRRHLPPALLFLGIGTLLLAAARPSAVLTLPSQHATVILAIDVSGSMRAEDVYPNRLVAAQSAAKAFVAEQPARTRIGIVEFSAGAALVQAPTQERAALVQVIDGLAAQNATAIGSAILVSLKGLLPDHEFELPASSYRPVNYQPMPAVEPGSRSSAAIVLLTDGQNTMGPDPLEAARLAASRGVRIYTVGFGTHYGEVIHGLGWAMRVELDEATLSQIAELTRGEYFHATNALELKNVYETLGATLVLEEKPTELSALLAIAAALLAMLASLLSLLWFHRGA